MLITVLSARVFNIHILQIIHNLYQFSANSKYCRMPFWGSFSTFLIIFKTLCTHCSIVSVLHLSGCVSFFKANSFTCIGSFDLICNFIFWYHSKTCSLYFTLLCKLLFLQSQHSLQYFAQCLITILFNFLNLIAAKFAPF